MADTTSGLGLVVSEAGNAVSDLFGSQGEAAQANSYAGGAALAQQNAQLTAASTAIQQTQTTRQVEQSLATTQADVAGAGFTESGSALDILKMSAQQGALAKSLVNIQGAINENSYAAQAGALSGEAAAANATSTAGEISGIVNAAGAAVGAIGGVLSASGTSIAGVGSSLYNSIFGSSSDTLAANAGIAQNSDVWVDSAGNTVAANTPGAVQLTTAQAAQLTGGSAGSLSQIAQTDFASNTDQTVAQGANVSSVSDTLNTIECPITTRTAAIRI